MPLKFLICTLLLWSNLSSTNVNASGGYSGIGVQPPFQIDATRYELGKSVFNRKVPFGESGRSNALQSDILEAYQKALPPLVQRAANLPSLAGRLSQAQFEGLQHFLQVRFNVRMPIR